MPMVGIGFMKEDDDGIITPSQVIHMGVDTIVCSCDQALLKIQPTPCIHMLRWAWFCHKLPKNVEDRKTHRRFPLFTSHAPLLHLLLYSTSHPYHELSKCFLGILRGIKLRSPRDMHESQPQSFKIALRIIPHGRGTRSRAWPVNHILR